MAQSRTHIAGNRVLVIDDDPDLQSMVITLLGRAGIRTTVAGTAMEGRRLLDEGDFQLLILDLGLPDMDGLELLEVLRRDGRFDQLPMLVLSAKVEPEVIGQALRLGADGYLTKPYLPRSLTQEVITLLAQGRRPPPPPVRLQEM